MAPLSTVTVLPNVMDVALVHEHVLFAGYVTFVITPSEGHSVHKGLSAADGNVARDLTQTGNNEILEPAYWRALLFHRTISPLG